MKRVYCIHTLVYTIRGHLQAYMRMHMFWWTDVPAPDDGHEGVEERAVRGRDVGIQERVVHGPHCGMVRRVGSLMLPVQC